MFFNDIEKEFPGIKKVAFKLTAWMLLILNLILFLALKNYDLGLVIAINIFSLFTFPMVAIMLIVTASDGV